MSWFTDALKKVSGEDDISEGYEGGIQNIQQGMGEAVNYYQDYADFGKKYGMGGLESLMNDPNALKDSASYKFRMEQGTEAIARKASASGYTGSGNVLYELTKYGQGLASEEYGKEWDRKMGLAGMGYDASGKQAAIRYGGAQDIASLQAGKGRDIGGMKYDWMRNERSYLHDFGMTAWSGFAGGGGGGGGG